ncbi:maleylpyruvate isomerase family mycothiol-dependent enzyme [Dermatobacter hominis]|uniref:maleylpyruvate isomerase family mycothiol-dependent enzyme n=1 Tax=Dermatobacter hominis TaxID=2884263 RepID=UPI001D10F986|nr:maleylpyruvate isomerase family mycothiol-dependent enzyme [Dermatobacter hominis]UDY37690.1 maleylpyruvate isomerase family mycothiol-dependent enzyme [Dermatobacter hominis]
MTTPAVQDTVRLRNDSARITELIVTDLSAPVPSCPGWTLRDLVEHLGGVHRWARECVETGAPPARARATDPLSEPPPEEADALARWFGDGAIGLANALDAAPLDAPTWTPFPIPDPTIAVWLRRQTHETALHRWDAEAAVASPREMDPALAADGVDEYLEVIVPRKVERDGIVLPPGSAHLHCTDTPGEWTVEVVDGEYVLDRSHRKGDAAIRGTAEHLLLRLWGRDIPDGSIEVIGDEAVASAWTSIGGN